MLEIGLRLSLSSVRLDLTIPGSPADELRLSRFSFAAPPKRLKLAVAHRRRRSAEARPAGAHAGPDLQRCEGESDSPVDAVATPLRRWN